MNKLIIRNYKAVVKRGLISPKTTQKEFWLKLNEEVDECHLPYMAKDKEELSKELTDVICVCTNWLTHLGFDIESLLIKNAVKNEQRADKLKRIKPQPLKVAKTKNKLTSINLLEQALKQKEL